MPLFPPRAHKILAQYPPGTIYLPKLGPTDPATIESFHSDDSYTWVRFKGQPKPALVSWPLIEFTRQLPSWQLVKLYRGPDAGSGSPRLKLIPAHS